MATAQILNMLSLVLPHDPIVLEAGAHFGEDTVQLAQLWPQGKVIAFEPNPSAFSKLRDAVKPYSHVEVSACALATSNGMTPFYLCANNDGSSSLLRPIKEMHEFLGGDQIEVPCVVLDDWCKERGVERIDCMWLDMEGFELYMLQSSPRMLSNVKLIYTETNHFPYREGTVLFADLKKFLESRGFKMVLHNFIEHVQGDALFIKQEMA